MGPKNEEAASDNEDALAAEARRLSEVSERLARKSRAIRDQIAVLIEQNDRAEAVAARSGRDQPSRRE